MLERAVDSLKEVGFSRARIKCFRYCRHIHLQVLRTLGEGGDSRVNVESYSLYSFSCVH